MQSSPAMFGRMSVVALMAGALGLSLILGMRDRPRPVEQATSPVADDASQVASMAEERRTGSGRATLTSRRPLPHVLNSTEGSSASIPEADETNSRHPYLTEDMLTLDDSFDPETAFAAAADEFHVPVDLLKAIAYVESGWNHRHGLRSQDGGFGVMGLRETTSTNTLDEASRLLVQEKKMLVRDPIQNIRGAAALLKADYDAALKSGGEADTWLAAVKNYSGQPEERAAVYARHLRNILLEGMTHTLDTGRVLTIKGGQSHLLPER